MGCCFSRNKGSEQLKKEQPGEFTNINDSRYQRMPAKRTRQNDDKHPPRRPPKTRKHTEYLVAADIWDKMVADNDNYTQHITRLQDEKKKDDKCIKDSQVKLTELEDEKKNMQAQLKRATDGVGQKDEEIRTLQRELTRLRQENSTLLTRENDGVRQKDNEIRSLQKELMRLRQENSSYLTRISAITGARLLNNNPNIANLGDANRPTKLADQYSELYDNEWTEAYSEMENKGVNEREMIEILRDMLMDIYKLCEDKATKQMEVLDSSMEQFMKNKDLPTDMIQHLKESRKENFKGFLQELTTTMDVKLSTRYKDVMRLAKVVVYRERCLELCWLMCIQDPPVNMDCEIGLHGQPFSRGTYKVYTTTGPSVDFVVWPALYLYKGGSLLSKGTAQAMK